MDFPIEHIRTLNGVYTAFDREGEQLVCYHHGSGRIFRLPESALTLELKRRERGDTMSEKELLDLSTEAGCGLAVYHCLVQPIQALEEKKQRVKPAMDKFGHDLVNAIAKKFKEAHNG